ncbi:unnamed protein product, partial [Dovyalis caffra]
MSSSPATAHRLASLTSQAAAHHFTPLTQMGLIKSSYGLTNQSHTNASLAPESTGLPLQASAQGLPSHLTAAH